MMRRGGAEAHDEGLGMRDRFTIEVLQNGDVTWEVGKISGSNGQTSKSRIAVLCWTHVRMIWRD